jgi:hypothetical protein
MPCCSPPSCLLLYRCHLTGSALPTNPCCTLCSLPLPTQPQPPLCLLRLLHPVTPKPTRPSPLLRLLHPVTPESNPSQPTTVTAVLTRPPLLPSAAGAPGTCSKHSQQHASSQSPNMVNTPHSTFRPQHAPWLTPSTHMQGLSCSSRTARTPTIPQSQQTECSRTLTHPGCAQPPWPLPHLCHCPTWNCRAGSSSGNEQQQQWQQVPGEATAAKARVRLMQPEKGAISSEGYALSARCSCCCGTSSQ